MSIVDTLTVRVEADTADLRRELARVEDAVAAAGVSIAAHTQSMERPFANLRNAIDGGTNGAVRLIEMLPDLNLALQRLASASKDIGDRMAKAFEDAAIRGKSLGVVLRELARDLARIVFKKTVTEPLGDWLGKQIGKILLPVPTPGFSFGGGLAEGGPAAAGVPYLVGERGPELFVPDMAGAVVPNRALAGGDVRVSYNIDARGAEAGVEARIRAALREAEGRTLAAVQALADRGGPFAKAVGRR